jgi:hypothetical protein
MIATREEWQVAREALLENRDVTFLAISRAPLERLQDYKRRMGWGFRWVSSHGSDFNRDFAFARTKDEVLEDPEAKVIIDDPSGLRDWSESTGADAAAATCSAPTTTNFSTRRHAAGPTRSRCAATTSTDADRIVDPAVLTRPQ